MVKAICLLIFFISISHALEKNEEVSDLKLGVLIL